MTARKYYK